MKNQEIKQIYEGINQLILDNTIKLKPRIGFILIKNRNILQPFYMAIQDATKKIYEQYGTFTNNQIVVENDKLNLLSKDLEEILNEDTEVTIQKITIDDLENNNISLELMWKINGIIKETQ